MGAMPMQHKPMPVRHASVAVPRGATESEWLRALRTCFPMDDRAFDFLAQQPIEVQETVIMEFRPRRDGDLDYSGAMTSFIKNLKNRLLADGGASLKYIASDAAPAPLMEAFRRRYPVDDRAWDFLISNAPDVVRNIVESFRPKFEGELDYSSLVTSFVKRNRSTEIE